MSRFTRHIAIAAAAAALLAAATGARADGMPGLRGHDHTGITVPDMKQATDFFVGVLGCKEAMSFGPFADEKGDFMTQLLNVNPRAVIKQITMVRCGYGSDIELFQYTSPDQRRDVPRNSDIGGHHVALYVDDLDAAVAHLRRHDVAVLGTPTASTGAHRGQRWVYFRAPWGMQLELVSYPGGKAIDPHAAARWAVAPAETSTTSPGAS